MTNELEKQFFDTFGIEPKWKSEQCDGWFRTTAVAYFTNLEEAKKFGIVFQEEPEYPQISDRILLELILIYSRISNLPICYYTVESFKEGILECFIENSEDFKHQVRTLFEEG